MRIIAGDYKGRRLQSPQDYSIRPTTDKVKEALFSILTEKIWGSRVLPGQEIWGSRRLAGARRHASLQTAPEKA